MRLSSLWPVFCSLVVLAAEPGANPPSRPAPAEPSAEELQTIRKIMELPPERIRGMREAIEHIEHMSGDDRKDFAKKLADMENATPEERRKAFKEMRERNSGPGFGFSTRVLEYHLKQLPADQAKMEREKFLKLPREERIPYVRKLMEKYGPELMKDAKGKAGEKGKELDGKRRPSGDRPPEAPPVPAAQ